MTPTICLKGTPSFENSTNSTWSVLTNPTFLQGREITKPFGILQREKSPCPSSYLKKSGQSRSKMADLLLGWANSTE
eukprot:CAMPEP_0184687424 /NCGR_PEP_ID=MMETSP0312-20130426/26272_1 /TAXON_ID=31354 /ORGANISM="Compsopogon coeruleus, Strain SAG 36.94" /LENGTH=76 /DNA_ID=CAMNT_0027143523 /DNA_START=212 /DNA_END=439 /DNA_ORIENTATION=-